MPPFVEVAVKVIGEPVQAEVAEAATDTEGVTEEVVVAITWLVAVEEVIQEAELVITTFTWSPLFKVDILNELPV